MKSLRLLIPFFILIILGCGKSMETIVVEGDAELLPGENDSTKASFDTATTEPDTDPFLQIKVGESDYIETLDPLFASSNSELRMIHLIYDGLTRLGEDGRVKPAIAKSWDITRDSLRYIFHLNQDVFFHNSSAFSSGLGRKVVASDVELSFLRMGKIAVPDYAANMFSNIRGFKAYHIEQTYVKNPAVRVISNIEGITVQNDSTIVFQLDKKDPDFLKKLAHPWASVYAKESLLGEDPIQRPIGTGAYYFVRRDDNLIILASNNQYPFRSDLPDRLDIRFGLSEAEMYQHFARGELDVITEIGPESIKTLLEDPEQLSISFKNMYELYRPEVQGTYRLFYNPASRQADVPKLITSLAPDSVLNDPKLGTVIIRDTLALLPEESTSETVRIAHTTNPFEIYLLDAVSKVFTDRNITLTLSSSYAVTDEVALATAQFEDALLLIEWHAPVYCIIQKGSSGLSISSTPWNISFSGFQKSAGTN